MLRKNPLTALFFIILFVISFFYKIVFLGYTLDASAMVSGVTPQGPYGYNEKGYLTASLETAGGDPGGSGWQMVSETEKCFQEFKKGRIPLWNPNQMLGTALAQNLQLSAFFPLRALLLINRSPLAHDIYRLMLFCLAGFFTFLYLRFIVSFESSLLGALCFIFSGFLFRYAHFNFIDIVAFTPLLLYATERLFYREQKFKMTLLSTSFGCVFLSGYPAPLILSIFFVSCYFIYRWIFQCIGNTKSHSFSIFAMFSVSILLGIGIGFLTLLPGLDLINHTVSSRPPGYGLMKHPFFAVVGMLTPNLLWFIQKPVNFEGWQGVFPCFLALCSIPKLEKKHTLFFMLFSIFCILKLTGFPLAQLLAEIPLFSRLNYLRYLQPILALCIAILTAIGFESIEKISHKFRSRTFYFIFSSSLMLICFVAINQKFIPSKRLCISLVTTSICILILSILVFRSYKITVLKSKHLLFSLVALELFVYIQRTYNKRYDPFLEPPFVKFLKHDNSRFRIFGFDGYLHPPYASAFDLDDVRWMNAIAYPHYAEFIRQFFHPTPGDRFTGDEPNSLIFFKDLHLSPLLHFLNIKYFISAPNSSAQKWLSRVAQNGSLKLVYQGEAFIYENKKVLPRTFLVHKAKLLDEESKIIHAMKEKSFNPSSEVILKKTSLTVSVLNPTEKKEISTLEHYDASLIKIKAQVHRQTYLVLSDIFSDKWTAYVNGQKAPIFQANLAFRAVFLEPGINSIEFRLEDSVFKKASFYSLISLILLGLLVVWEGVLNKKLLKPQAHLNSK